MEDILSMMSETAHQICAGIKFFIALLKRLVKLTGMRFSVAEFGPLVHGHNHYYTNPLLFTLVYTGPE